MPTTNTKSGPIDVVTGVLSAVRRSLLVAMAAFGFLLILLGMSITNGVYAGMFGIWGAMLIVIALIGIGAIQLLKRI
ncbi:hypothetical protein [Halocatena marina]|uniref:Uncharacterized protein n=1 Tax=Halocatena marina TaxID=2934937 RepID=A0ABD5YK40_9EURY|nr:hypothetical protein [Halocatena marina]